MVALKNGRRVIPLEAGCLRLPVWPILQKNSTSPPNKNFGFPPHKQYRKTAATNNKTQLSALLRPPPPPNCNVAG